MRHLEEAQQMRTEKGRAEIMLDPVTFLRLNEESRVEMVKADLSDVRVRVHAGSVLVEVRKKPASGEISILSGDAVVAVDHKGLFRIDTFPDGPPRLRVFRGEFIASLGGVEFEVGSKESLVLTDSGTPPVVGKSDSEQDAFDRWNRKRASGLDQDERARQQAAQRGECGSANFPCTGYPYPGSYPGVYGYPGRGSGSGPSTTVRNPTPAPSSSPPPASTSRGGHGGR